MADYSDAKRGVEFIFDIPLEPRSTSDTYQANPTLASGDVKISKDDGTLANLNTLPSVSPAGSKNVKVTLSATEMTADRIVIIFSDQAGDEWKDRHISIRPSPVQMNDIYTRAGDIKTKTDQLTFGVAGQVDANTKSMNSATVNGNGTSGDLWRG